MKMMKKNLFLMGLMLLGMSLGVVSCGDDDDVVVDEFQEQTYSAWSKVVFAYGSMYDGDESIHVSKTIATFHSDTWGDGSFTISELTKNADNSYTVKGEGKLTMAGHGGTKDYEATISGTIAVGVQTFVISIPSVMGGTTINATVGTIPAVAAVDGTYTGGTYADAKYFQKYQPTKDEKVVVKASEGYQAVTVNYTSETWGAFTFESVSVVSGESGAYTLSGEGKTVMPGMNGGDSKEYPATFKGTIKEGTLVATFAVPSVMGGTTVYFNAEDFEQVYAAANPE